MIVVIMFFLLFVVCLVVLSLMMGVFGVPYVPTPKKVLDTIVQEGLIHNGQFLLELGAGDARFLRRMHRTYTIHGIGYEISPLFFSLGWLCITIENLMHRKKDGDIHLKFLSYFHADFAHADVIYCYLLPHTLRKLTPHFKEMKDGSMVISYNFKIAEFIPEQVITLPHEKYIYVYKIKHS